MRYAYSGFMPNRIVASDFVMLPLMITRRDLLMVSSAVTAGTSLDEPPSGTVPEEAGNLSSHEIWDAQR